jgi:hypothetical protein
MSADAGDDPREAHVRSEPPDLRDKVPGISAEPTPSIVGWRRNLATASRTCGR